MAKRGPIPKPFLLKMAEGNRGRRKQKPGALPPPSAFEPPFPLDGMALREWNRLLAEVPWLRAAESVAIADRCLCFQRLLEAEQDIRDRGSVVRTRNGNVLNPSIRIARGYRISLQRYDSELGLTSSARTRIDPDGVSPAGKQMDSIESKLCG